jgi:hypothetical protein
MWEEVLSLIAKCVGPMPKGADGSGEVTLAVSGVAVLIVIPDWMRGRMLEITAHTTAATADAGGVDVLFGKGAGMTAAVYQQATGVDGSGNLTVHAASGRHIVSGQTRKWLIPSQQTGVTHMSIIASGAGFIQMGPASEQVTRARI